jgi:SOS-response transcriptional repressor LexA
MTMRALGQIAPASCSLVIARGRLTARQAAVLGFLERFFQRHGYAPTMREIGAEFGIRSTNGVSDHLRALERKGYVVRSLMKSRALVLVREGDELPHDHEGHELDDEGNVRGAWEGEALALRHLLRRVAAAGSRQMLLSAEMVVVLADIRMVLSTIPGGGT